MQGLLKTSLKSLPLVYSGKVRDSYAVGDDKLLIVATDRISAFDFILSVPIPYKGQVLTQLTNFWFEQLKGVLPNHLTGIDPLSVVAPEEADQVRGRSVVAMKLKPIMIECVARGYLTGGGWKEYLADGSDKPLTWQDQHIGKHLQRNPQPQGETAQQEHHPPGPIGLRHQRGQQLCPQVDADREEERGRNLEELYGLKPVPEQQHLADQHGAVHQEGKHPQREPWKDKREDIGEAGHRRGAHTG